MSGERQEIVYVDACVVVALLGREEGRYSDCRELFDRARKGEIRLYTSFLTQVETVKGDRKLPDEIQEQRILGLFANPWIHFIQLSLRNARTARQLIREHTGLRVPDAIHIASALEVGARYLYTYDHKHLIRLNGKIQNIIISEPPPSASLPLVHPDM